MKVMKVLAILKTMPTQLCQTSVGATIVAAMNELRSMLIASGHREEASLASFCGVICLMISGVAAAAEFTAIQPDAIGKEVAVTSAWADFDGDGDLDLAVAMKHSGVRLYRNDQGTFVNVGPDLGLPTSDTGIDEYPAALAWGDYDEDGDLDLYVGTATYPTLRRTQLARNYLYRNDAARSFSEVAKQTGVEVPGANTRGISWLDYDNDGDLDLFVSNRSGYGRLFRNDDDHFEDVSGPTGLLNSRRTVGACWFDMDQDGDLDLFLANQDGDKDSLYQNDGGKFTDVAAQKRMDQPLRTAGEGGVGCSVGDFDNDGDLDLFVATYGNGLLYSNDGAGQFQDVAQQVGITGVAHAVAANWGDYDNDGHLDLLIAGYEISAPEWQPRARLFHKEGARFVEQDAGLLSAADHGVQWADYDRDGDLDLALTTMFRFQRGQWILRNELSMKPRTSLQISVLDAHGNYTRAGSEVRLYDAGDRLIGTRLVPTGDGYNSQSAAPLHFGLPKDERVTVAVTFLTPEGRKEQRLRPINPKHWAGKVLAVKYDPLPRSHE